MQTPARPRYMFCQFPNGTVDSLYIGAPSSQQYLHIMATNGTLDGSKIYIAAAAGSVSGTKITVYHPDSSTVVETWDNNATNVAAVATINAGSSYIYASIVNGNSYSSATPQAPTAIGNAYFQGVVSVVQTLYPPRSDTL